MKKKDKYINHELEPIEGKTNGHKFKETSKHKKHDYFSGWV